MMVIFKIKKDNKGNTYYKVMSEQEVECNFSYNGVNKVFKGIPMIILRTSNENYGEQIMFNLFNLEQIGQYNSNTNNTSNEIYLDYNEGIKMMELALEKFRQIKYINEQKKLFDEQGEQNE